MSECSHTLAGHRFHGDPQRFPVIANLVASTFHGEITYIADVASGQGMLTRILRKKYNYDAEVIDPRGFRLKGVPGRETAFSHTTGDYYDLIIALHPDNALREVMLVALQVPALIIPCCNFLDTTKKLGEQELLVAIERELKDGGIKTKKITFDFRGPKNVGLLTSPPKTK